MSSAEKIDRDVLIRRLHEAASVIDKDDLVVLADIHGWCESLIGTGGSSGEPANDQLLAIKDAAEQLIMGVSDDPEKHVKTIHESASAMASADSAAAPSQPPAAGSAESAFSSVISELSAAAAEIEADNLTLLAKMHGWCGELAAAAQPGAESADPTMMEKATTLGQALEALILGVEGDAESQLQLLKAQIDALAGEAAPQEAEAPVETEAAAPVAEAAEPTPEPASEAPAPSEPEPQVAEAPAPAAPANAPPPFVSEPLLIGAQELEFVGAFVEEAAEHLEAIEAALLEVEQAPHDKDKINELFRPFHTIKGMAGFLNLRDVNSLTHEVETVLDQGRRGERELTSGTIDLVFAVVDILKAQLASIGAYVKSPTDGPVPQPPVSGMIDRLRGVIAGHIDPDAGGGSKRRNDAETPVQQAAGSSANTRADNPAPVPTAQPAATPQQVAGQTPTAGDQSVRIDTHKLDALVDMVGELVIAQTLVAANDRIVGDPKLMKDASQVSKIVRDVQEVAMAMRMIPIKSTFQKMARLVRDLSRKADKKVELTISGEETELDKNVIQQIGDPLVHMVRNAVDHGIEPADERRQAGKPECGRVHLNAFHQGGNIVIQIIDDGKGLDRDALIVKAIEKGLIGPDDELTEDQAYHLIFAAGFSTAKVITDISGRGVGMDVVKRNIEQLRGRVDITSAVGKGSTFSIKLPLTLAIIDGMLVRVGKERFIIATPTIEQALRPLASQITTVQNRGEVLQVRGKLIPLLQLGQLFGLTDRVNPAESMVVIAHTDSGQVGLVVEELIGQQQVVIKSLGEKFRGLRGISGAAILGDGRVGLILDASGIRAAHDEWHEQGTIRKAAAIAEQQAQEDATDVNAAIEQPVLV